MLYRLALAWALCGALGGCEVPGPVLTEPHAGANRPPVAVLEPVSNFFVGTEITFDASGSFDPDGDDLRYDWGLGEGDDFDLIIQGSSATLHGSSRSRFELTLWVTDSEGNSDSITTTIDAVDAELAVDVDEPAGEYFWNEEVELNAMVASNHPVPPTLEWSVVYSPDGLSPTLAGTDTETLSFVGNAVGKHTIQLRASVPGVDVYEFRNIRVIAPTWMLGQSLEAVYSPLARRVIFTHQGYDSGLRFVDVETQSEVTDPFSPFGHGIDVSPLGEYVLVRGTRIVDAVTRAEIATVEGGGSGHRAITDLGTIWSANHFGLAPSPDTGQVSLYDAAEDRFIAGVDGIADLYPRPNRDVIYDVAQGSIRRIERVGDGLQVTATGGSNVCEPLFIRRDESVLLDGCGQLIALSASAATDLSPVMTLTGPAAGPLSVRSAFFDDQEQVWVLDSPRVYVFDVVTGALVREVYLPPYSAYKIFEAGERWFMLSKSSLSLRLVEMTNAP